MTNGTGEMIPLYHDFEDQTVLVFGGGSVGYRKARRFAAEADVVVVSPAFDDRFADVDDDRFEERDDDSRGSIELVRAAPSPSDVEDWIDRFQPALVVIATNNEAVNAAAADAARERGVLRNNAVRSGSRDPESVTVPATVTDGPVSVAISTGARSPALAKHLREQIEAEIDGAGAMAELSGELRDALRDRGLSPSDRRAAIRAVVRSDAVWKALHTGDSKSEQEAERVIDEVVGDT